MLKTKDFLRKLLKENQNHETFKEMKLKFMNWRLERAGGGK